MQDEFSHLVQEWNNLRSQALERAFTQVLYPQMTKELVNQLLDESREHIVRVSLALKYVNCSTSNYDCVIVMHLQNEAIRK